jgi:hypothetical protein
LTVRPSPAGGSSIPNTVSILLRTLRGPAGVVPFADLPAADDEAGDAILESGFTPEGRWREPPARWQVNTPEGLLLRERPTA